MGLMRPGRNRYAAQQCVVLKDTNEIEDDQNAYADQGDVVGVVQCQEQEK